MRDWPFRRILENGIYSRNALSYLPENRTGPAAAVSKICVTSCLHLVL